MSAIKNAQELKENIETSMLLELKGSIDVFVLDVSKNGDKKTPHERGLGIVS
ncbi:hypothetical protein [Xenorhabdus sp. SGI246]|uniref:hypothetical protein n=1 Tax=Xenorhabdus sp. SGI246 TaxID=3158263 RepID=UPI00349F8BD1